MDIKDGKKRLPTISMQAVIIGAALLLLFFAAGTRFGNYLAETNTDALAFAEESTCRIDVKGAVERSGLYEMPAGSRISDLLEVLELSEDAQPELLNRAAFITDGSELIIPQGSGQVNWNEIAASRGGIYYNSQSAAASSANQDKVTFTGVININTAGAEELQMLSGIGPAKASAIISYREKNGNFLTKEQIMNVSGIGQGTFDKIKDNISVE